MKAELVPSTSPRWSAILDSARHDFYHLPAYTALCADLEAGVASAAIVEAAGATMLVPLVIRPIAGGGRDATSPYGFPGPLIAGAAGPAFVADA
ncbi:MAG TPA: hypothetical protein VKA85_01585, partial [Candidatus Limnocylindrales bacterium]|nr:hypothetical protein [Candidatus Limnocylindrales bacterium]